MSAPRSQIDSFAWFQQLDVTGPAAHLASNQAMTSVPPTFFE